MNPTIENIDNELIFDIEHIIMNYVKMNNFISDCLKNTNIQISQNVISNTNNPEFISNSNKFASKYFQELSKKENIIDLLSPVILDYPNSDLALFLTVILKQHIIEISPSLNLSTELFQKYKNEILSLYRKVLPQQKNTKLLENICAPITVLLIIGFQGQWTSGIDQLISAAQENNGNNENNLMAALIISNIDNIYTQLEAKIENLSSKFILTLFEDYSPVINKYINFLIQNIFSGDKQDFVNSDLFKAFIGMINCFKYFKINIIKIHGFCDFLINCISYININEDFILTICDLFDNIFSMPDKDLKFDYLGNSKLNDFIKFLNDVQKNEDFEEIIKCIKLIHNLKNYYSNKNINEIKNNQKDIQIIFAACNIFCSICENYGYIFIIPEIDDIVQDIYNYFINLPIYKINLLLLSSLKDLYDLSEINYKFENYDINIRENKKQKLNSFLYAIQNSVLQNMKLTNEEVGSFNIEHQQNKNILSNSIALDKYIDELLKTKINDDEKIDYILNSDAFYNDIFDIINNLFNGKDYCDKLYIFLDISAKNNDLPTIDSLMNIFNMLSFKISTCYPGSILKTIDYIFTQKEIFLKNQRLFLQLIKFLFINFILLSKNQIYLNLILDNFINNYNTNNCEEIKQIIIILINKLILSSYQLYKINIEDEKEETLSLLDNNAKNALKNNFDILSKFLIENMHKLNHYYLYKIIDAFYHSLFFNIALNIINGESIYTASEKLLKDCNQIYNNNIIKYIHILWCIVKNIGKEDRGALINLLNKIDPSYSPSQSYISNIQNNILKIVQLNNKNNFNKNIIDCVILFNNTLILFLKEKTVEYYDYFNKIISIIISNNPTYVKIYNLTYTFYSQIFIYNQNSEKYNIISQLGFDLLNSLNMVYHHIQNEKEDDIVYTANKQTEFLILYIQKCPYFINNLNKEIFVQSINNIINIYENSNNKEFSNNFMILAKILFDLSINNTLFHNLLKDNFIEKIIRNIISHIQYFNINNRKCAQTCFDVFKSCIGTDMAEKFYITLNDIYKDKILIDTIVNYVIFLKDNKVGIDKKIKEFLSDLSELYYAIWKKRNEFIKKYENEINNNNDNVNKKEIRKKVDKNSEIFMDLYAQ